MKRRSSLGLGRGGSQAEPHRADTTVKSGGGRGKGTPELQLGDAPKIDPSGGGATSLVTDAEARQAGGWVGVWWFVARISRVLLYRRPPSSPDGVVELLPVQISGRGRDLLRLLRFGLAPTVALPRGGPVKAGGGAAGGDGRAAYAAACPVAPRPRPRREAECAEGRDAGRGRGGGYQPRRRCGGEEERRRGGHGSDRRGGSLPSWEAHRLIGL